MWSYREIINAPKICMDRLDTGAPQGCSRKLELTVLALSLVREAIPEVSEHSVRDSTKSLLNVVAERMDSPILKRWMSIHVHVHEHFIFY